MNCEKYQDLLSDLVDGLMTADDRSEVETHLRDCVFCAEVRDDFVAIVGFCQSGRGEYDDVPNERALWLRISNIIEAEAASSSAVQAPSRAGWWSSLMHKSWQLSFPKLAASAASLVLVVSVATVVGLNQFARNGAMVDKPPVPGLPPEDRYRQQQQAIAYWNQRVDLHKASWNAQMRETFDRNMSVIDAAVNDSMTQLRQNPHDAVSEDILNDALSDKVALLKEFADL